MCGAECWEGGVLFGVCDQPEGHPGLPERTPTGATVFRLQGWHSVSDGWLAWKDTPLPRFEVFTG